jgi:hypothetical protein
MAEFSFLEKTALSFPEVSIEPHFEKLSFRVRKKIFVTFDEKRFQATVKLTPADQDAFSSRSPQVYPVDNKWGEQGWTVVELTNTPNELLAEVLKTAYKTVAPKKLIDTLDK